MEMPKEIIATALIAILVLFFVLFLLTNGNGSCKTPSQPIKPQIDNFQWDKVNSYDMKSNSTFRTMDESWSKFGPSTSPAAKAEISLECLNDNVAHCQMKDGRTGFCTTFGFCMPENM